MKLNPTEFEPTMRRSTRLAGLSAIAVVAVAVGCLGKAHAQKFQAMGNANPTLRPPPDAKGWVIVTFEGTRAHMSFDLPGHIKLITENGIPYTNGATETYIMEEGFHEGASYAQIGAA